jgi:septum site-determining protein MinD
MSRIIGIVSGKGGVGKTTTTINLAFALHQLNERVVAVDCDLGTSNMCIQLGFYQFPYALQNVLENDVSIGEIVYIHPTGLRFVPASISMSMVNADTTKLKRTLAQLNTTILVDSPPGLDKLAREVMNACDELLIVTNPELSAVTDAIKVIEIANTSGKQVLGAILNRVENKNYELTVDEVEDALGVNIVGIIPEDKKVKEAAFHKLPVAYYAPYSKASLAYMEIAAGLFNKGFERPKFLFLRRLVGGKI